VESDRFDVKAIPTIFPALKLPATHLARVANGKGNTPSLARTAKPPVRGLPAGALPLVASFAKSSAARRLAQSESEVSPKF
jgi:hypothetical protein